MDTRRNTLLNPDLVINRESAIDRMSVVASRSAELESPNYDKQVWLVRQVAKDKCDAYQHCSSEDWCIHCNSGKDGNPLFRGLICLNCKLFTADALFDLKHSGKEVACKALQQGEFPILTIT